MQSILTSLSSHHICNVQLHSAQVTRSSAVCWLQIWTIAQDNSLQLLHVLVQTAFPIASISLNLSKESFLIALTDGTMTLWQLDTLQELYQYKHVGPVHGLTFTEPDEFYFYSHNQVCGDVLYR